MESDKLCYIAVKYTGAITYLKRHWFAKLPFGALKILPDH